MLIECHTASWPTLKYQSGCGFSKGYPIPTGWGATQRLEIGQKGWKGLPAMETQKTPWCGQYRQCVLPLKKLIFLFEVKPGGLTFPQIPPTQQSECIAFSQTCIPLSDTQVQIYAD